MKPATETGLLLRVETRPRHPPETIARNKSLTDARKFQPRGGYPDQAEPDLAESPRLPRSGSSCDDLTVTKVTSRLWYSSGVGSMQPSAGRKMPIQLTPTKIKGSRYLLIPKDLAQLLEIDDKCILNLTIEDTNQGQRLVYAIREKSTNPVQ